MIDMRPSILLTLCVVLFSIGTAMGQCHLRPASASQLTVDEAHRLIAQNKTYRDGDSVITIPVVFHVLHQRGVENISYAQILDAIDHLNKDFRALNTDLPMVIPQFQDVIGDARIEFKLATKDAEGNCTNGVERIRTVQTLLGRLTSYTNQWPRDRYLNVWTHRMQPGAMPGPGPFPPPEVDTAAVYDGILIHHSYVGGIGTSTQNRIHVLTHEVGHYLGLIHPWGLGEPGVACGDDGIDDTPMARGFLTCPGGSLINAAQCESVEFTAATATYTFDEVSTTSGTTDPSPPAPIIHDVTGAIRVEFTPFMAVGVGANSTTDGQFAFDGWGTGAFEGNTLYQELTGALSVDQYYEMTVVPAFTDVLQVDSIRMRVRRSHDGPRTFSVRASYNLFASNLAMAADGQGVVSTQSMNVIYFTQDNEDETIVTFSVPTSGLLNPATYRIYAWNAESEVGVFSVDDLQIIGKTRTIANFQNFMEYSYCTRMFTEGQCERMWATLASSEDGRNNLGTLANLEITGCTEASHTTCAPEADFYAMVGTNIADPVVPFSPTTCTGTTVLFHDNSSGTSPTSWQWSFQDGEPATSTEQHPTVTFDTPGWKEVNLTVSNAFGSSTLVDTTTIWIGDVTIAAPPQMESFEAFEEFGNGWIVANNDEIHTRWQLHTGAGCMGNASIMLNSGDRDEANIINPTNDRDIDDLITPMMDFTDVTSGLFTFCWSYGAYEAPAEEITERLEVRYSINCGRTWTQFFPVPPSTIQGINLITNAGPTDPEVWQEHTLPLPATLLGQPTVRFRFRFISGPHSGHLYLDNIGVTNSTAVTELAGSVSLTIMPNPAQGTFTVVHPTLSAGTHGVELFDMRGALVHRIGTVSVPGGSLSLDTRSMGLHAGVYVVQVSGDRDRSIGRLVVH